MHSSPLHHLRLQHFGPGQHPGHPLLAFTWNWHRAVENCRQSLIESQNTQKLYYDRKTKLVEFLEGDHVLLREGKTQTGKVYFRWDGPYVVTKKISSKNYVIKHLNTTFEFVVGVDRLKKLVPYVAAQTTTASNATPPTSNIPTPIALPNVDAPSTADLQTTAPPRRQRRRPKNVQSVPNLPVPLPPQRTLRRHIQLPSRFRDSDIVLKY